MKSVTLILTSSILILWGCSSKVFQISVNPEGSMVRYKSSIMNTNIGEAESKGLSYKAVFVGKRDSSCFIAMKRGYAPDSVYVNKESDLKVAINLKRNNGDTGVRDYSANLSAAVLSLLPAEVEARYHTGVGNIGRFEKSDQESARISTDIMNELTDTYAAGDKRCRVISGGLFDYRDTTKVPTEAIKYLISLDPTLIRYYGVAPSLKRFFKPGYPGFFPDRGPAAYNSESFLAVIYCKTIKPTGGRVAGNLIAGSLASAMPGTAASYNPAAFNLDNSTLITVYFIHYPSGEIIRITQKSLQYDMVNEKGRKAGINVIKSMLEQR